MSEVSVDVNVKAIRDNFQAVSDNYVKHIFRPRKKECIEAAGDVLFENGYLPNGTTWEAWGDACWFSVDKGSGTDLAHYFHEGIIYGPNFFIKKIKQWRSPKGEQKKPNGKYLDQYVGSHLGVRQWTKALIPPNGDLYDEYMLRCEEILRR